MNQKSTSIACPCGGMQGKAHRRYADCCGRFLDDGQVPTDAADLMRSRYTAFTLRNEDYLRATWWPDTLPGEAIAGEDDVKWIGLKIVTQTQAGDHATVEFIARFKVGGRAHKLHEISHFIRARDANGMENAGQANSQPRWYYVDGVFPDPA